MSGPAMATVAAQAPTSVEDLMAIGVLGENVVKEYGERLVKNIKAFVELEHLQKYIDRRPPKRPRTADSTSSNSSDAKKPAAAGHKSSANSVINVDDDDDDEFDVGIDFSAIEIPEPKEATLKSPYFR